ncbi:MAG: preprotein translocase subunit SecA [Chloroflexota bacterium]|nr:preprotein translocase subunit SecA [Chloroflexota bacterium]MED6296019.1 preprotein translocase subunit SecA [Chloroflexota bacterium]
MAFLKAITNLIGNSDEKALSKLDPLVEQINALERGYESKSNEELRSVADVLKSEYESGKSLDELLPDAFAAVRESAKRTLGQRHFDVQLLGGIVLHQGKIAEMRTGEGKTLVATLPAFLNSISGEGVHVVTVNDYLAKRDAEWMGAIYNSLGVSVSALQHDYAYLFHPDNFDGKKVNGKQITRKDAYESDITYGTNNDFGFDYLRDNMVDLAERRVQRGRSFAIVDEVDNILVDEARTPLIISGPSQQNPSEYSKYAKIVPSLREGEDYSVEEKHRSVSLTQNGIGKIEKFLKVDNLYDAENFGQVHFVENAVRAEVIYKKDREYVVKDGKVVIVDEFTGRLMDGRRYSDGLHQAIEAKENITVQRESVTYATITLQNYFRLYSKLSGMTGTASTEAEEFWKIYKLEVLSVPTNNPVMRSDHGDLIYRDQSAKYNAVVREIKSRVEIGQPVLVGTTDIDRSEILSGLLKKQGIKHEVLNAKQHDREATIVAQAGKPGAVTVATNMAGRGTDIVLGGSPDFAEGDTTQWEKDHDHVLNVGGLFIIGTERHEARRIDNQLRGRSGRQGDPGETRFYCSLDDDLVRRFGGDRIQTIMDWAGMDDETPIENKMISRSIEGAQVKVESFHFDMRKNLVEYDDVVNSHRDVIYEQRDAVLDGVELRPKIQRMIEGECEAVIAEGMSSTATENWDIESVVADIQRIIPLPSSLIDPEYVFNAGQQNYINEVLDHVEKIYNNFEAVLGDDNARSVERYIMLRTIDANWVQHLTAMENLRQGISLQAVGQRDPLVMYKKEGHELFQNLQSKIIDDVVHTIFRTGTPIDPELGTQTIDTPKIANQPKPVVKTNDSSKVVKKTSGPKIGRNEQCPCGSGKKYKRCCGLAA